MGCHGGFSLDDSARRKWYNPEQVLQSADVKAGGTFVDVGCGEGFFSLLAARLVGKEGKVYAVDIDSMGIEKLKRKAVEQGLTNIHAMVGRAEETVFCNGCADVVFFSMVLHDFADPSKVLANAHQMLKLSGRVVNLDWKKAQMPFGPPVAIRFSEEKAQQLLKDAGFTVLTVSDAGPYHYVVTAKPVV
jgi:ubiquinone/menaquinone biosynthesis C-methylase UbiE